MDAAVKQRIDDIVNGNKMALFMKGSPHFPQCGFSAAVVQVLAKYDRPYHAVDVLSDAEVRQGIKEYSDWPTIPQLYINGKFVGGCDITLELDRSGELGAMLKAAFGA